MCPVLPDDSVVLTLPFGGAVLQTLGIKKAEADSIIEEFKEQYLSKDNLNEAVSFLETLEVRLPDSIPEEEEVEEEVTNIIEEIIEQQQRPEQIENIIDNNNNVNITN